MASSDLLAATSMLPRVLAAAALGTASADLVAPATNRAAIIKSAVACNTTAAAATLTVTVTKSGGSTVTIVNAYTLAAGDSTNLTELVGAMLGPGDKVSALSGTASAISVVITGTDNS